ARQVYRNETDGRGEIVWESESDEFRYIAVFNTCDEARVIRYDAGTDEIYDIWAGKTEKYSGGAEIPAHGVKLMRCGL
ncbi:MAG: hypothetical protein IKS04_06580, partial [Clostridia bacterium]|nr:hypothetical protein [Clostridia bacterium]